MLVHKSKRKEHEEEMLGSSSGLHGYTASLKKKKGREFPARVVMLTRIRMEELMIQRKFNNYL